MGGGAGAAAVAAAAEPEVPQAALADLARVVPWACQVRGCSDKAKNGATNKYIARHRKYHKYVSADRLANSVTILHPRFEPVFPNFASIRRDLILTKPWFLMSLAGRRRTSSVSWRPSGLQTSHKRSARSDRLASASRTA